MSASASRVYGLDNVPLELPIAGVGSRVIAAFLDYLIIGALVAGWIALMVFVVAASFSTGGRLGLAMFALTALGIFVIEYGYFAGFEIGSGGRTPGKMAVGLHVVTRLGARPSWGALLARNLVRTVDLLLGVPLMAFDSMARRIGDRIAGTLVVYATSRGAHEEPIVLRTPEGWSSPEVAVLESFLRRAAELDPSRARGIAERLLTAIRRSDESYLADLDDGDPVALLRRATTREQP